MLKIIWLNYYTAGNKFNLCYMLDIFLKNKNFLISFEITLPWASSCIYKTTQPFYFRMIDATSINLNSSRTASNKNKFDISLMSPSKCYDHCILSCSNDLTFLNDSILRSIECAEAEGKYSRKAAVRWEKMWHCGKCIQRKYFTMFYLND